MEAGRASLRVLVIVGALVVVGLVQFPWVPAASAGLRTPAKTITLPSQTFDIEVDPVRPLAYISARSNNSVLVFSFAALDIIDEIPVGLDPWHMDIDPRTDRLYVALGGGPGLAVVNLTTRSLEAVWSIGSAASDVVVGRPGRLYVSRTGASWSHPAMLDSTTGAFLGNITDPAWVYGGSALEISPDNHYLFIGERGLSPSPLYKVDVTTDAPVVVAENSSVGENLQDMSLSPDGGTLYYACGAPYEIHAVRTSDLAVVGAFATGPYPSSVAISADGSLILGGKYDPYDHTFYSFDAATFQRIDSFRTPEEVFDLAFDPSGEYVLAFNSNYYAPPYDLTVFSMSTPANQPPVASFSVTPGAPYVDQLVSYDASSSSDVDGSIIRIDWLFGDGAQGSGGIVQHVYSGSGTYTVSVTVTDDVGQTDTATQDITVAVPPDVAPTASFNYMPAGPVAGDVVTFDGSPSSDPYRPIVSWTWAFGDGAVDSGRSVTHVYATGGTFLVDLTVTNTNGRSGTAELPVPIGPPPNLDLVMFSHPSGFRLPVPSAWERQVDRTLDGTVYELILLGPVTNGFQTNIIVDTGRDSTVRETDGYLRNLVDQVMVDIRSHDPDASMVQGPLLRRMSDHAGIVFAVAYPSRGMVQKMAVVVSDVHDRYWILLLSANADYFPLIDPTFERMLAGFEITLAAPILGIPAEAFALVCGAGIIAAVLVIVAAILLRRRRKAPPPPVFPAYVPAQAVRCGSCGAYQAATDRFCARCGNPLGARSTTPPPPPPPLA